VKLPRDLSARELIKALERLDYRVTRQTGSHVRLTCLVGGEHHVTIPNHSPLRVGTLNAILSDIANHRALKRDELYSLLFD